MWREKKKKGKKTRRCVQFPTTDYIRRYFRFIHTVLTDLNCSVKQTDVGTVNSKLSCLTTVGVKSECFLQERRLTVFLITIPISAKSISG